MAVLMTETCRMCGYKQDVGPSQISRDFVRENIFNYQCEKCGALNRVTQRNVFVDITPLKHFVPTAPIPKMEQRKSSISSVEKDDYITSKDLLPGNPFSKILRGFEEKEEKEFKYREAKDEFQKIPQVRTKIKRTQSLCQHPDSCRKTSAGISYCTLCGKNFERKPMNMQQDYGFNVDEEMVDEIFEQAEPSRGRPSKAGLGKTTYLDQFMEEDLSAPEMDTGEFDEMVNDIFPQAKIKRGRKEKDNPFEYIGGKDILPFSEDF